MLGNGERIMSVPTWERTLSKTQFLYELYQLNVRLGEIVYNKPAKYRVTYGDKIVTQGIEAMRYAQAANLIFMSNKTTEADYNLRRKYLLNALSLVDSLSTLADIFLSLNYRMDGCSKETLEKNQIEIGSRTKTCHDLIKGVLESDKKVYGHAP